MSKNQPQPGATIQAMIKSSFTKIGLSAVKADLALEKQITSFECDLVEEQYNEQGDFIRALEKKVKLRNQWVHVDALKIFDQLRAHMALICEMQQMEPDYDDPMAELQPDDIAPSIFVKSVQLTGGNENLRVTLFGFKTLAHENTLDLKSPAIRLDDMDYPFVEQLLQLISDLESEARQAIYEQKGVGQLNMFDEAPGEAPQSKKAKRKALESFADDLLKDLGDVGSVEMSTIVKGGTSVTFTKV